MHGGFEIVLWVLLAVASVTDLIWGKIHNLLTFSFLTAGVVCRLMYAGGTPALYALFAAAVAFVVFFPLYYFKVLAAGDVKLMMAVGAWTDWKFMLELGAVSIVVGAAVGVIVKVLQKDFKWGATTMPFAPAFLCAFFIMKISEIKGWHLF